jgi:hypothetical protein
VLVVSGGWAGAAERDTGDVRARVGLRLYVNLPRKWELDLNYRHKMVDDLSTHRGSHFTLKVERRLEDWITAIGAYRRLTTDEGNANRFAAGVELDTRLGSLKASFRPLIQYRTAILEDDEVGGDGQTFVRTRLRLEYPLTKRLDVYACLEPFFGFGQGDRLPPARHRQHADRRARQHEGRGHPLQDAAVDLRPGTPGRHRPGGRRNQRRGRDHR